MDQVKSMMGFSRCFRLCIQVSLSPAWRRWPPHDCYRCRRHRSISGSVCVNQDTTQHTLASWGHHPSIHPLVTHQCLVLLGAHALGLLALAVLVLVHLLSPLLEHAVGVVAVHAVHLLQNLIHTAHRVVVQGHRLRQRAEHAPRVPQILGRAQRAVGVDVVSTDDRVHGRHALLHRERTNRPHLGRVRLAVLLQPHGRIRAFKAWRGLDWERWRRKDLGARGHERAARDRAHVSRRARTRAARHHAARKETTNHAAQRHFGASRLVRLLGEREAVETDGTTTGHRTRISKYRGCGQ